jgi:hypothetical protein
MKFHLLIEINASGPMTGTAKDQTPAEIAQSLGLMFDVQFAESNDDDFAARVVEAIYIEGT